MAFRIGDMVVRGELINTRRNSVHGWLQFRGTRHRMVLSLTGNCGPDLAGRHIRFEARDAEAGEDDTVDPEESDKEAAERLGFAGMAWQQIGPTGTMVASRMVRVADCPPEELYMRCKLDEPPPTEWKRCLYLEWYSQNGRVVLEMPDPVIEFVDGGDDPGTDDVPTDEELEAGRMDGLSITSIHVNDDGEYEVRDETPHLEDGDESCDGNDDPYGLMPSDLQRELDAQARATDRALSDDDSDDVFREHELLDDLIEHGEGEPIGTLFDGLVRLKSPDSLDEAAAEQELKCLLIHLAMIGIAFDMCEHFTYRDAYRLLVEHICREQKAFKELRKTRWVQHFSTCDYCDACQAEFESDEDESK